jgi:hypothetical protein
MNLAECEVVLGAGPLDVRHVLALNQQPIVDCPLEVCPFCLQVDPFGLRQVLVCFYVVAKVEPRLY